MYLSFWYTTFSYFSMKFRQKIAQTNCGIKEVVEPNFEVLFIIKPPLIVLQVAEELIKSLDANRWILKDHPFEFLRIYVILVQDYGLDLSMIFWSMLIFYSNSQLGWLTFSTSKVHWNYLFQIQFLAEYVVGVSYPSAYSCGVENWLILK